MYKEVRCTAFEKLLKNKRTPVLFLGSGFSKRYLANYMDWMELLHSIGSHIGVSNFIIDTKYNSLINIGQSDGEAKQNIGEFLEAELNKKIAENNFDYIFDGDDINMIQKNNYLPFKYLVSKLIPAVLTFKNDKTYYSTELRIFKQLINTIPCIITTNYDNLIEYLFGNKFTTYVSQPDYFYNDNTLNAEIYKIHGTLQHPNSLVITDSDYKKINEKAHLTSAKLLNILSSHPVIFIGYSLSDSDINKIIENMLSCLTNQQIDDLSNNLLFIERKENIATMNSSIKEFTNGLKLTYIVTDNFTQLFKYLSQFKPHISPLELRKYFSLIKELVASNDNTLERVIGKPADLEKLPEEIAITDISQSDTAYSKTPLKDIVLAVLYETNKHDPLQILNKWFTEYIPYKTNAPLYYYIKRCTNLNLLSDKSKNKIVSYLEIKRTIKPKATDLFRSVTQLENALNKCKLDSKKIDILIYNFYNSAITKNQYVENLKLLYESNNSIIDNSDFKKAVMFLDWDKKTKI